MQALLDRLQDWMQHTRLTSSTHGSLAVKKSPVAAPSDAARPTSPVDLSVMANPDAVIGSAKTEERGALSVEIGAAVRLGSILTDCNDTDTLDINTSDSLLPRHL